MIINRVKEVLEAMQSECDFNATKGLCCYECDECHLDVILYALKKETTDMSNVIEEAIKHYGKQHQMMVACEEMSELIKELVKNIRGEDNRDHIAEEIADVEIMLTQMKLLHKCSQSVSEWKLRKLERLEDRINEEKRLKKNQKNTQDGKREE